MCGEAENKPKEGTGEKKECWMERTWVQPAVFAESVQVIENTRLELRVCAVERKCTRAHKALGVKKGERRLLPASVDGRYGARRQRLLAYVERERIQATGSRS